jgi:hypothetical protein
VPPAIRAAWTSEGAHSAYTALRALGSGKAVGVGVPRFCYRALGSGKAVGVGVPRFCYRALGSGKAVGVGVPRFCYRARATIDDPSGQLTEDQAKEKQDKLLLPPTVEVRSSRTVRVVTTRTRPI